MPPFAGSPEHAIVESTASSETALSLSMENLGG
jgi:hypothetical protein